MYLTLSATCTIDTVEFVFPWCHDIHKMSLFHPRLLSHLPLFSSLHPLRHTSSSSLFFGCFCFHLQFIHRMPRGGESCCQFFPSLFIYLLSFISYRGTSGIDIDLRRVDIDQCPQRQMAGGVALPLNIFAGTDKCKARTTEVIYKYLFYFFFAVVVIVDNIYFLLKFALMKNLRVRENEIHVYRDGYHPNT